MSTLVGTGKLIRLILRRDRLLLPLWIYPCAWS
jgi:putative exporter of polyketide antibiotics